MGSMSPDTQTPNLVAIPATGLMPRNVTRKMHCGLHPCSMIVQD